MPRPKGAAGGKKSKQEAEPALQPSETDTTGSQPEAGHAQCLRATAAGFPPLPTLPLLPPRPFSSH